MRPLAVFRLSSSLLIIAVACHHASAPQEAVTPSYGTLAVGQDFTPPNTNLRITFDRVNGDSRCPVDAVCIQAGTAEIAITVREDRSGNTLASYVLKSFGDPREFVVAGYRVRLEEVMPVPHAGVAIPASEYRVRLSAIFLQD